SKERLILRDLNYYRDNRIDLVFEEKVEKIDTKNKCVVLASGKLQYFDKLLVAVGGRPVVPNIEGLGSIDYLTLNSIHDAEVLRERAAEGQKAVVVGAGLTGIEVTFALKRLGMKATLVEREMRLLPMQLDAKSGEVLAGQIRKEGIELLMGKNVQRIVADEKKYVEFSSSERIEFDMLVITIGTRPNLEIVTGTEIQTGRGILVDEHMETTVGDIFAAGDVAETAGKKSAGCVSSYIWSNALAQGKCAAYNMAGQAQEFSPNAALGNAVRLRDIPFISMGMINPDEPDYEELVFEDERSCVYKKVVIKDNRIKGMILLGDTSSSNTIGELIRKEADVSKLREMILDNDFSEKYKALL
ncbi:MAG: NAD(P)/FAD-dependent oxidoreductase, partial [Clostridiaceae bacterium]|nr:NAD(P)/FAD-dependent oxidoreductase [Clostridiaceae bacterium]